jgi:hypothetical protein
VKIPGEFTWHRHADTDEFFLVLDGQLTIQMRDGNMVLAPRELFVVPAVSSTVRAPIPKQLHDLRHTAASVWLAAGADPRVVQRVLGHATAAMTKDLYGHMIDANLWQAAQLVGDISDPPEGAFELISAPGKVRKPLGAGLSRRSRLGESNPRPTHYERVPMRCLRVRDPRLRWCLSSAAVDDHRLLMVVRGHLRGTSR